MVTGLMDGLDARIGRFQFRVAFTIWCAMKIIEPAHAGSMPWGSSRSYGYIGLSGSACELEGVRFVADHTEAFALDVRFRRWCLSYEPESARS